MKKARSDAERAWRQQFSDERWEKRADYLMEFFSQPSGLLRPVALGQTAQEERREQAQP